MFEPFKEYVRTNVAEMRPVTGGEINKLQTLMSKDISISEADRKAGSPKAGDMIARNPKNHEDQWLVAAEYFNNNFKEKEK